MKFFSSTTIFDLLVPLLQILEVPIRLPFILRGKTIIRKSTTPTRGIMTIMEVVMAGVTKVDADVDVSTTIVNNNNHLLNNRIKKDCLQ